MANQTVQENDELRANLAELKRALPKLDKIEQRLQMYEAQLESISELPAASKANVVLIQENLQHEPIFEQGDGSDTGVDDEDGPISLEEEKDGPTGAMAVYMNAISQSARK